MTDIEKLIKKLKILATKPSLSKAENEEVTDIMKNLKAAGMSNEEISEASNGRWSPSTVKGRTKGIKTHGSHHWQSVVSLLGDILAAGISLDDLKNALIVINDLKTNNIEVDEMIDVMSLLALSSIEPETFVEQSKQLISLGISIQQLSEAFILKKTLKIWE